MPKHPVECNAYVLDTCKISSTGKYVPGAITFRGRKKVEVFQWKGQTFDTQDEADEFVRRHFENLGFGEPTNEMELFRQYPSR
jgi:hypothetical protein